MIEKRKAVIIGAGIGGITASIYLARKGYNVDIFEKNNSAGGRCGQIIHEGHRFDLGATMLMMPGIYREIFDSIGISLEQGKDIIPLKDLYKIHFDDGTSMVFSSDRERMRSRTEDIEPGSFVKAGDYIKKGYDIYNLGMERLIKRNFYHLFQIVNFRNIGLLVKLKVYISNWNYARKFFKDKHLLMAYTFQNIYVGQSPFSSPALFSMVPAAELTEGSFFHKGGMFGLVEKLIKAAESYGVKLHFSTPVEKIAVKNKKAEGILLENGTFHKADIIVANADLPYVYRRLLPDKRKSKHIDRLKYSCSAICFHWGLDKQFPQLDHHTVFLSDDFRKGLEKIMKDKTVGEKPSFYVHAPSRTDPSSAPPGHDTLSFVVATGHIDKSKNQNWDSIMKTARQGIIDRLKEYGLTDIEEHIKFEIIHTPVDWEYTCNISRGSVFGSLGHNILQMGYFRPHNRHDKYGNLYFTGGSTHPGNGIPNVLISAKLTAERIIKEHNI